MPAAVAGAGRRWRDHVAAARGQRGRDGAVARSVAAGERPVSRPARAAPASAAIRARHVGAALGVGGRGRVLAVERGREGLVVGVRCHHGVGRSSVGAEFPAIGVAEPVGQHGPAAGDAGADRPGGISTASAISS